MALTKLKLGTLIQYVFQPEIYAIVLSISTDPHMKGMICVWRLDRQRKEWVERGAIESVT